MGKNRSVENTVGQPVVDAHQIAPTFFKQPRGLVLQSFTGSHTVRVPVAHLDMRTSQGTHVVTRFHNDGFASTGRPLYQQQSEGVKTFFPPKAQETMPETFPADP